MYLFLAYYLFYIHFSLELENFTIGISLIRKIPTHIFLRIPNLKNCLAFSFFCIIRLLCIVLYYVIVTKKKSYKFSL